MNYVHNLSHCQRPIGTVVLWAIGSVVLAEDVSIESLDERIAILQEIVEQQQANYDKIRTWQGRFALQEESLVDGKLAEMLLKTAPAAKPSLPLKRTTTAEIHFAVDVETDQLFTTLRSNEPPALKELASNKLVDLPLLANHYRSLLSSQSFTWLQPNARQGQIPNHPVPFDLPQSGAPITIRDSSARGQELCESHVIDPRRLFGYFRQQPWEELNVWCNWLDKHPDQRKQLEQIIQVEKQNSLVKITITRGPELAKLRTTYLCDSQKAHLVVERVEGSASGPERSRIEWVYREVEGVYLPAQRTNVTYDSAGIFPQSQRSLTLHETQLNEPISHEQFSLKALGILPGGRLLDKTQDKLFIFDGDQLIEPSRWRPGQ